MPIDYNWIQQNKLLDPMKKILEVLKYEEKTIWQIILFVNYGANQLQLNTTKSEIYLESPPKILLWNNDNSWTIIMIFPHLRDVRMMLEHSVIFNYETTKHLWTYGIFMEYYMHVIHNIML
jgi:hypothetical protein